MVDDAALDAWEALDQVEKLASAAQHGAALSLLARCVDRGMFWHPYLLRSWLPSLASSPAFQAVSERMDSLRRAADATATTRVRIIGAERAADARAFVILLHGGGGEIDELRTRGDLPAAEQLVVAFVQSSQHVAPGKYGWIDVDCSIDDLPKVARHLRAVGPVALERAVIGGFSQGGHLAMLVALCQRPFATRGFVGFGVPTDSLPWPLDIQLTRDDRSIRGWFALGADERPWRVTQAEHLVSELAARGVQCRLERIPNVGHALPPDCTSHLLNGIRFVLMEDR